MAPSACRGGGRAWSRTAAAAPGLLGRLARNHCQRRNLRVRFADNLGASDVHTLLQLADRHLFPVDVEPEGVWNRVAPSFAIFEPDAQGAAGDVQDRAIGDGGCPD